MILLDTHVLIWWVNGDHDRLSGPALSALESEGQTCLVSAISCWEVAVLVAPRAAVRWRLVVYRGQAVLADVRGSCTPGEACIR